MFLLKGMDYLLMVFFIMLVSGLAKEYNLFAPAYAYVKSAFRSSKFVVVLLSAIGGVLPIEGRVTVSAGLLDTVAPEKGHGREKFGIIDYLSTHHYYMWSPLEKTVILPIAAFGLTYAGWLAVIWPLLLVSLAFIGVYIWTQVKDEEVRITPNQFKLSAVIRNVLPMVAAITLYANGYDHIWCFGGLAAYYIFITQQWSIKKLLGYVNWQVLLVVAIVIIFGNYVKEHSKEIEAVVKNGTAGFSFVQGLIVTSVLSFVASLLMGSSGKFAAMAVMMAQIYGIEYFLWFFAIDFAGYLLSPTHKCVAVGNRYFGTSIKTYYAALSFWGLILLTTAALITFVSFDEIPYCFNAHPCLWVSSRRCAYWI